MTKDDFVGQLEFPMGRMLDGHPIDGAFRLVNEKGDAVKGHSGKISTVLLRVIAEGNTVVSAEAMRDLASDAQGSKEELVRALKEVEALKAKVAAEKGAAKSSLQTLASSKAAAEAAGKEKAALEEVYSQLKRDMEALEGRIASDTKVLKGKTLHDVVAEANRLQEVAHQIMHPSPHSPGPVDCLPRTRSIVPPFPPLKCSFQSGGSWTRALELILCCALPRTGRVSDQWASCCSRRRSPQGGIRSSCP